ncbi:hypothetical protein BKA62DRAFT_832112 [Auriculariales sp. MPI-PUGE-AT-0066]|nr:hypothetical protein BKA62DRAFT_832112 [Auriculariales sp. MPI-PUGE-AT-0066]
MEHRDYNAILGVIRPVMKTIPVIGNILEGSVETLIAISTQVETARANKQELVDLLEHTIAVETQVTNALHTRDGNHQALKKSVERFVGVLIEVKRSVKYLQTDDPGKRETAKRKIGRYFQAYSTAGRIATMKQRISDAATVFGLAAHVRTEQRVLEMLQLCREMADDVLGKRLDEILKPAHAAVRYDKTAPGACTDGTRVGILSAIHAWAESDGGPIVYWLAGLAGTGKTTIARSICDLLVAADVKVLSFFISRSASERNTLGAVVKTLAYQLAKVSPVAMMKISTAAKQHPPISFLSIVAQTKALLVDPLTAMWSLPAAAPQRMVIVIDALDECEDFARFGGQLLATLIPVLSRTGRDVKLFLTSRYEQNIRSTLDGVFAAANNERETFLLHEVDEASVSSDIRTFINNRFGDIRRPHSMIPLPWPSEKDIDELVFLSGKLFVYASTVLNWIGDPRGSPTRRLAKVLHAARQSRPVDDHEQSPHRELDTLYLVILGNATSEEDPDAEENSRLRQLLFLVTCAGYDVSSQVVAGILMLEHYEILQMLESLSAVLQLPTNQPRDLHDDDDSRHAEIDIPAEMHVRAFHKSFPDFLVDPRRCSDRRFLISRASEESKLALAALRAANMLTMPEGTNLPFILDQRTREQQLLSFVNSRWSQQVRRVLVDPDVDLDSALSLVRSLQEHGAVELLDPLRVMAEHLRLIQRLLATLVDTLLEASRHGFREQLILLGQASFTADTASARAQDLLLLAHAVTATALIQLVPEMASAQNNSGRIELEINGNAESAYRCRLQDFPYILGCHSDRETDHFAEALRHDAHSYISEVQLSEKTLVLKLIEICLEVRIRFQERPAVSWLPNLAAAIWPLDYSIHHGQELHSSSTEIHVLVDRGLGNIYARWSRIPFYWPSRNQREELVNMLEDMPESISLALSWIDESRASPVARLTELLVTAKSPQTVLDPIYRQILDDASHNENLTSEQYLKLRQIIYIMTFSGEDAYLEVVRGVLDLEYDELEILLDSLSAILESPKNNSPPTSLGRKIRILSEAFADFIVDPKRCTDERFLISHDGEGSKLVTSILNCVGRPLKHLDRLEAHEAFEAHIKSRWCVPLLDNLLNPALDSGEVYRSLTSLKFLNSKIGYVRVTADHLSAVCVLLANMVDNLPESASDVSRENVLILARLAASNVLSDYHELVFVMHVTAALVLFFRQFWKDATDLTRFEAFQSRLHG